MMLRAVLFDLDGTLVRTFIDFPAIRKAVREIAARYGVSDAVAGEDDILEIVEKMARALGETRGAEARQIALREIEAREQEGCAHPEAIAAATPLLYRLRRDDIGVAIITRNGRALAESLLQRMDLPHDVLIAREDVPEFKPHPAPLWEALRRLETPPSAAVMVGDLWADIAAGRAAGVARTIGIHWTHDPPDRFARCAPDVEVTSLDAVADYLRGRR